MRGDIPDWPVHSPHWMHDYKRILLAGTINNIHTKVTLDELEAKSETFPIKFPIDSIQCKTLKKSFDSETLEKNINSVYPIISEDTLRLYAAFILFKCKFGNVEERQLYANMSIIDVVDRLLQKRAVLFLGEGDIYMLLNGKNGSNIKKLALDECLSYDEIKLSALLSVSSYSCFINDGNRYNRGITEMINVEPVGVVVGLIGTRFEKAKVMEYEDIVITGNQNTQSNGYGVSTNLTIHNTMSLFYDEPCFTFDQIANAIKKEPKRFVEIEPGMFFDKTVYCKRLALSFDTLLHEANIRAKEKNTTAFIHVVGIGLGVWKISDVQDSLFLDAFAKRIKILGDSLHSVSDVVFAYFRCNTSGGFKSGDVIPIAGHPKGGIKIYFLLRQPHTKLTGDDEGKLLVVSYAWDGNALPGNEFWSGSLSGSGDPAQACSSQVAELHNPHINPQVCGANLRIATRNGVVPFSTYRENVMKAGDGD